MADADDVKEILTQDAGPLPVWVWDVGIGVIAVAYIWWTGRDSGTTAVESAGSTVASGSDAVFDAIDGAFKPGTSGSASVGDEAPTEIDTNVAWGFRAVSYLVGQGIAPVTAQVAIGKYLAEEELTDADAVLVNRAVAGIGAPPTPIRVNVPTPPTPPAPVKVTIKSWQRLNNGQVVALMSDGTRVNKTLRQYIDAGMPAFSSNAYENQTYKVKSNGETAATIAKKFNTSVDNIIVLNRWKAVPNLKKRNVVKVPSVKGSGKS